MGFSTLNHRFGGSPFKRLKGTIASALAGASMASPRLEPPPPEPPQSARENPDRAPRQRLQDAARGQQDPEMEVAGTISNENING